MAKIPNSNLSKRVKVTQTFCSIFQSWSFCTSSQMSKGSWRKVTISLSSGKSVSSACASCFFRRLGSRGVWWLQSNTPSCLRLHGYVEIYCITLSRFLNEDLADYAPCDFTSRLEMKCFFGEPLKRVGVPIRHGYFCFNLSTWRYAVSQSFSASALMFFQRMTESWVTKSSMVGCFCTQTVMAEMSLQ